MSRADNIYGFLGQQIAVGLSAVIGVTVSPSQTSSVIKYSSGGTLWAGGATVSVGAGYLFTAGEAISVDSSGTMYFASAGATTIISVLLGLGQ